MKKIGRITSIILCLLAISFSAVAVEISADIDSNDIYVGESFTLNVKVSSNRDEVLPKPTSPRATGSFKIKNTSSMTSVNIINGKMTKTEQTSYEMISVKAGTFIIMPGSINTEGQVKSAPAIKVIVNKKPVTKGSSSKPFFVKVDISDKTPYVGQQLTYSFKFFVDRRYSDRISRLNFESPKFDGFWHEQLKEKRYSTHIHGNRYIVIDIPIVIFPTRSGEIEIDSSSISFIYSMPTSRSSRRRSIFDDDFDPFFSFGSYRRVQKSLSANEIKLNVKEVPFGKSLPVGNFKVDFSLNKTKIRQNDVITAKIILEGNGNISDLSEPDLKLPEGFKKYTSKSDLKKSTVGNSIFARKTFEFALVPENMGKFTLGPVEYKFFDPRTKKIRTAYSDKYNIEVEKGESNVVTQNIVTVKNGSQSDTQSGEDVKIKDEGIRYIKGDLNSIHDEAIDSNLMINFKYYILIILFPILSYLLSSGFIKFGGNKKNIEIKKTLKNSLKHLNNLKTGDKEDFKEMYLIIQKFLAVRFEISTADITANNITKVLTDLNIEDKLCRDLASIMEEINFYSHSGMTKINDEFISFKEKLISILKALHSSTRSIGK